MSMPTFDVETGLVLGLGAGFGALGGLTRYLVTKEDLPRTVITGLVAAFAAMFVARPVDWVGLITGAAAAGYASDAVLAGFISRTKLEAAKADAEAAKLAAGTAKTKSIAAEADLSKALGALKALGTSGGSSGGFESDGPRPAATTPSIVAELEASQRSRLAAP